MNEIANVRAFFNERHITLNSEWEDDAIGYVKSQLRNGDDILKLSKSVFVQWLNSDLRESTQPTLNVPANATGITVVKPALVQLTSILNISESAYSQYRSKIMDLTEDNSEFRDPSETSHEQVEKPKYGNIQPKKPPMYMYKLSDGNITLKAVIAETINGLDCNTPIGAKLLLIPKFLCRYRVLKLTSQNCQFLGGYNEQCIDKDDPLSKLLNRIENTENRQPPLISQPVNSVPQPVNAIPQPVNAVPQPVPSIPKTVSSKPQPTHSILQPVPPISRPLSSIPQPVSSIPQPTSSPSKEVKQFKKEVKEEDIEIITISLPSVPPPASSRKVIQKTEIKEENDIEIITIPPSPASATLSRNVDEQLSQVENAENIPLPSPSRFSKSVQKRPLRIVVPENEEVIPFVPSPPLLRNSGNFSFESPESKKSRITDDPVTPGEASLVTKYKELKLVKISQALQLMKFSIGSKKVKLTAYLLEILEPFSIEDGEWTMKIRLKDETCDDLKCFVSHQLLCNLIGMTPDEAMAIRKSSNFAKRKEGTERIKTLDVQLQRLDLIFEIEFFAANRATPRIIGLETLSDALQLC